MRSRYLGYPDIRISMPPHQSALPSGLVALIIIDALPFNARPRGAALAAAAGLDGTYSVAHPRECAAVAAVLVDGAAGARSLADQ
eukprot:5407613-Prymnesium_polylepis.1